MAIDKIIDPNIAANAYANNRNIANKGVGGDDGGISFSQFLKNTAKSAVGTLRNSEAMAAKAITEKADITDVVQAATNAEITLQTIVTVRDRLVSAYQEIMRMPI